MTLRILSHIAFGIALGCAALLQVCAVPEALTCWAMISIITAAILTNVMQIRSMGIAGVSGLVVIYRALPVSGHTAQVIIALASGMTVLAILLAIFAQLSDSSKGKRIAHEI